MRQILATYDRIQNAITRLQMRLTRGYLEHQVIFLSLIILTIGILIVATLYAVFPELRDGFLPGVFVEFNGMLFDIAVFGILIAFFVRATDRRQEIDRQQEIIDDYKKWNSDEAKFRIAGAIRRLNRSGKTNIDFGGIELTDFSFRQNDIRSIQGASFYDGTWGEMGSRDSVKLNNVDFTAVDCRNVIFSKFNPFRGFNVDIVFASIKDCSFGGAKLSGAVFNGAHLEWTTEHPAELGVWHEDDQPPWYEQTYYPPFCRADLNSASFVDARFKNADFRDAEGVLECDFTGASGLETCLFDNEDTKNMILNKLQGCIVRLTKHLPTAMAGVGEELPICRRREGGRYRALPMLSANRFSPFFH